MDTLTGMEKEYFDEVAICFEEEGEITTHGRRFLERIRQKLLISGERAQAIEKNVIEASKQFAFSEVETEYVVEFRACLVEDGEITSSARRLLDRIVKKSDVSEERRRELETLVLNQYAQSRDVSISPANETMLQSAEISAHPPTVVAAVLEQPAVPLRTTHDILRHIQVLLPDVQLHRPDNQTFCFIPEEMPEKQAINFYKKIAEQLEENEIVLLYFDQGFLDKFSSDNELRESSEAPKTSPLPSLTEQEKSKKKFSFSTFKEKAFQVRSSVVEGASSLKEKVGDMASQGQFDLAHIKSTAAESAAFLVDKVGDLAMLTQTDCAVVTNKRLILKKYAQDAVSIYFKDKYDVGVEYPVMTQGKKGRQFDFNLSRVNRLVRFCSK